MLIYKYEKSFLQRLEDFKIILDEQVEISVKDSFKDFLESQIEPAGFTAIWQLTRVDCENSNIKFPCEVFGEVIDTDFDNLEVTFRILSVQDEKVHLPEVVSCKLEDIYPTVEQDNKALKERFDLTADCLDRFRFFFNYIFFPFDDEEDKDFVRKHLLSRLTLFYDLKNKRISKGTASRIRKLIMESKYIEAKKSNLEDSFNTEDELDISSGESKEKARKLLELHLRMSQIKNEMEVLANPEMRDIYEELKFPSLQKDEKQGDGEKRIFTVAKTGTLCEQMQVIESLKGKVNDDAKIQWLSLSEAIAAALYPQSEIYIPSGEYPMSFYEFLNGDVVLAGLTTLNIDGKLGDESKYAKLTSDEPGSMLFAIDGDLKIQDLIIDCQNVKTGFIIKNGKVTVRNCMIRGSKDSSLAEAFNISGEGKVLLENCLIENFSTGVFVSEMAKVNFRNVKIINCGSGIIVQDESMISLEATHILGCSDVAITKYANFLEVDNHKVLNWNDKTECGTHHVYLLGDGNKFMGNRSGDVIIAKKLSENAIFDSTFEELDSSLMSTDAKY